MNGTSVKKFLFVCGTARSGTTALTELLNYHPKICVGMERYRRMNGSEKRIRRLTKELFAEEAFFDFQLPSHGGMRRLYDSMRRKYPTAEYVGDKIPHLFVHYDIIDKNFECPIFLYIVRDILPVALSWNVRAADPEDAWPSRNDFRSAVDWWNRGNLATLQFAQRGGSVYVVEYERLFSSDQAYLAQLLNALELDTDPSFQADIAKMAAERSVRALKRPVDPEIVSYLDSCADQRTCDTLKQGYSVTNLVQEDSMSDSAIVGSLGRPVAASTRCARS